MAMRIIAVKSPNMATAVWAVNHLESAYLLQQIVPAERDGFWLVFEDDEILRARLKERLPNAEIVAE